MGVIKRLRITAMIEGCSYLLLLFIAMPLKYMMDMPLAVRIVGSIHGALFMVVLFFILQAFLDKKIDFKMSVVVFVGAILPFGPFLIDKRLRDIEE